MIIECYVTGTVTVVTNALFLILLNCMASRLTVGRIASNSHSNRILNVDRAEMTFFWHWPFIACFAALLSGHLDCKLEM